MDTTKSSVIFKESINKLLIVSEYIVLMAYAFYETSVNDPTVKRICLYFEIIHPKNHKKQTFRDQVTGKNFSTVINEKS